MEPGMKLSLHKKISLQPDTPSEPAEAKLDAQNRGVVSKSSEEARSSGILKWFRGRYSPGYNLGITICGIVIAEAIAMAVVYFYRSLPYYQQVVLDAAVMTVIIFPLLYFLSSRPLLQHIQQRAQTENILQARLRFIQYAHTHTLAELPG